MSDSRPDLRQQKLIRMTTQPVQKLILRLSVPTIASMLVTAAYNFADTYFVSGIGGHEGTCAISAVSLAFSVMALIQALGFFVGQGASNYISRLLGAKNVEKASVMAATGLVVAVALGLLITIPGELFVSKIAEFLGAKDDVVQPATAYLRWIFAVAPIMTGAFCLNNQLRFQGNAVYAMVGVISGALLNVALDPLFIHYFGMGAEGAAAATAISQCVGFLMLLGGTFRGDNLRIHLSRVRINADTIGNIVKNGLPSLLRQGFAAIAVMLLNMSASSLGDRLPGVGSAVLIAAFGLVSKIATVASYVIIGLGQGYQPVCGFNYGARKYSRVRKAFWFLVLLTAVWCVLVTVLMEVFSVKVVNLFPDAEEEVKRLSVTILRLLFIPFCANAWVVPSNMTQQTIGRTVSASILAMARQGLFMIPLVLILPPVFGLIGLELCQPISDSLTLLLAIPLQISVLRHLKQPDREAAQ